MNSPLPEPSRWARLSRASRLKTPIFEVCGVRFRHPGRGAEREFVVIEAPDWVNVVAVTPDHEIVLVRQFRYGINEFSLEIPGGVIEPGEGPVPAGARELQEETGYVGTAARLLGSVHPNPAFQSNRSHFVLIENAVHSAELAWDTDEEISVSTAPVAEVLAAAHAGRITHSLVLNALMLFEREWGQRRSRRKLGRRDSGRS